MKLRIYNTLTQNIDEFNPQNPPKVTMYSCGPTVYDYQHIGHMRRYVGDDILIRILRLNGYEVKHAMNITDVGHLVSDSDEGEDKMEKGARKFGKSVWDIAKMFEKQFVDSCQALNIDLPKNLMHATDFIKEQIALIEILEKKGFTYQIEDGIYFDSSKFAKYGKLTGQNLESLKAGARVEMVKGKKHPTDFALWKFSYPEVSSQPTPGVSSKRQMEWESPWSSPEGKDKGVGFPGWHIECSTMAMKTLGQTLDIHTGGIDHIPVHHTNEIAQSEAATGKEFVRFWVHHNFLLVEGAKMSKSLGNTYTVQDVIDKNFDPMVLRYLYLQTHYRQEMNFTWDSLKAAQTALDKLREEVKQSPNCHPELDLGSDSGPIKIDRNFQGKQARNNNKKGTIIDVYERRFIDAVNDDMNMPKALAVVWELMKSEETTENKTATIKLFDDVLGLELFTQKTVEIPAHVLQLVEKRKKYRAEKNYEKSDELRDEILGLGFEVLDEESGKTHIKKLH